MNIIEQVLYITFGVIFLAWFVDNIVDAIKLRRKYVELRQMQAETMTRKNLHNLTAAKNHQTVRRQPGSHRLSKTS